VFAGDVTALLSLAVDPLLWCAFGVDILLETFLLFRLECEFLLCLFRRLASNSILRLILGAVPLLRIATGLALL